MKIVTYITTYALLCGSISLAVQNGKHESAPSKTEFFANVVAPVIPPQLRHFGAINPIIDMAKERAEDEKEEAHWELGFSTRDDWTGRRLFDCDYNTNPPEGWFCVRYDFPADEHTAIYRDCPADLIWYGGAYEECGSCVIFAEADLSDIYWDSTPRCNSCTVCIDRTAYDCSNFAPDEECATRDCDGDCINTAGGGGGTTTPPTPTTTTTTLPPDEENPCQCFDEGSSIYTCYCQHVDGLITVFENCQVSSDGIIRVPDCGSCMLVEEETIAQIDSSDRICNSCAICPAGSVFPYAQDCSNIDPVDPCMVDNCDGQCVGGTTATSPTPPIPLPRTTTTSTPQPGLIPRGNGSPQGAPMTLLVSLVVAIGSALSL